MTRVILIVSILFALSGCNKPNTEPENEDPIYKDLLSEFSSAEKEYADKLKKVEDATLKLKEIVPQTGQTKRFYGELYRAQNDAEMSRQKMEFLKQHASSRKYEARRSYIKAFEAKQPWPDPAEYNDYLNKKKAAKASRNWRDRYPAKSEGKKAEKSEHSAPPSHE